MYIGSKKFLWECSKLLPNLTKNDNIKVYIDNSIKIILINIRLKKNIFYIQKSLFKIKF